MGKASYIGVSSKAHKIKKAYIGVSSKARKIKKAYIGVGGKARLWWTSGRNVIDADLLAFDYDANIYPISEDGDIGQVVSPWNRYTGNYYDYGLCTVVCKFKGKYYCIVTSQNKVWYTVDFVTYTTVDLRNVSTVSTLTSIYADKNMIIISCVKSDNSETGYYYSYDGITWTYTTSPYPLSKVISDDKQTIIIGCTKNTYSSKNDAKVYYFTTSDDSYTENYISLPRLNNYACYIQSDCLNYQNGYFIAPIVNANSQLGYVYSSDGKTWNVINSLGNTPGAMGLMYYMKAIQKFMYYATLSTVSGSYIICTSSSINGTWTYKALTIDYGIFPSRALGARPNCVTKSGKLFSYGNYSGFRYTLDGETWTATGITDTIPYTSYVYGDD